MTISNKNIRSTLWLITGLALLVGIADLVIALAFSNWGRVFTGWSMVVIPILIAGAYLYLGLPIFQFDTRSKVLHIKSHMFFGNIIGKEIYVPKQNIQSFEIKTERIRKKLTIYYLKNGKEYAETFSIALLHNRKIALLARQVELIRSQLSERQHNYHLFI